jgi:transcriptional regulator with XRE-family HTH domain
MGDKHGDEEKTFGETIRRLRGERLLTQREVAERLGINFTYLSKLENDRGERPGEETVRKLAEILRADAEELLALAGKVSPELRDRAKRDAQFARLLRHLPNVSDDELQPIYQRLKIGRPKK